MQPLNFPLINTKEGAAMLVVGAVFVDVKGFSSGTYLPEGTNVGDVQVSAGGVCRNVVENLARMGFRATFLSMVDDNAMGQDVRDGLNALGVDTTHVFTCEKGMGMWLAILDEHGDLRGSISRQPDFKAMERYIDENGESLMEGCDGVVLGYDTNSAITAKMLQLADRHNVPVYGVVGNMGVILRHPEYLRRSACFICNENEAGRLFNQPVEGMSPEALLPLLVQESRNMGIPAMVITMGPKGSVYVDHRTGEFGRCPARAVNMVDSTGAGDAFFTGVVAALNQNMPLAAAVLAGTRLAARTLEFAGACCPDAREIFFGEDVKE